jgi:NitT/TauT family transport system substrate-binding protein
VRTLTAVLRGVALTSVVLLGACGPTASSPAGPSSPLPEATPIAAAPSASSGEVTLPTPEVTSLTLAHASLEASEFTIEYARRAGIYEKYGLTVETTYFEGGDTATQALIAGQVQGMGTGAPPAISSQRTDTPLVLVAMYFDKVTDNLVSRGDIKSAADLKGKRIAVSQLGGDSHASVVLALRALGLANEDVTIVPVGGQSARIAALKAGSVDAAPVDASLEADMVEQGFTILSKLAEAGAELPRSGLVLDRAWMTQNPNTALALVAANLEAQHRLFSDTEAAIDAFADWTQSSDREAAAAQLRDYLKLARKDLRWNAEPWITLREIMAAADPALADVDVTKAYSFELLDKLDQMGFKVP